MMALIVAGVFVLALLLTGLVRVLALRHGVIDMPNERSSHAVPTPRGGGLAIVCACALGWAGMWAAGLVDGALVSALTGGGLLVACVGLVDDRRPVSPVVRLITHFVAASWAIYALGGVPRLQIGDAVLDLGTLGDVLGVLGVVWVLNLFNFMDGIDGIAASEAACVSIGGATLAILLVGTSLVAPAAFVLASACLAFLCWNWPPARIFMGDVGSGFLGFSIAVLALAAAREQVVAPWCWLILGAAFFVDATVTLLRRLLRRERLYLAHRSHAYQKLAECYGHRAVTVGLIAINMVILFPASLLAAHWFSAAALVAVTAITVLAAICIRLGAGH